MGVSGGGVLPSSVVAMSSSSSQSSFSHYHHNHHIICPWIRDRHVLPFSFNMSSNIIIGGRMRRTKKPPRRRISLVVVKVVNNNNKDIGSAQDTSTSATSTPQQPVQEQVVVEVEEEEEDPQDLEYVSQIKSVLERLQKNRDMLFNEVKLTVMIEDPRDVERKRLLGIDDETAPTRDDLADALVQVNEGKIPKDRVALQMLAEEMLQWPNLEVEIAKKKQPGKSLYAKFTDTGINPLEAAKRLNIDWDTAAEIENTTEIDDVDVPPVVGYGALYLVTAFPVIIGISVVLILFYNSLQ